MPEKGSPIPQPPQSGVVADRVAALYPLKAAPSSETKRPKNRALAKASDIIIKQLVRFRIGGPLTRDLRALVYGWCYIVAFMVLLVAATTLFVLLALVTGAAPRDMAPLIGGALGFIGLFAAVSNVILGRILENSNRRLGAVDLFISEISSICSVIIAMRLLPYFQELASIPDADLDRLDAEDVFYSPSENYLQIFEKHYAELGSFSDPVPIRRVTAFYSYLRGSRDAFRAMQLWRRGPKKKGAAPPTPVDIKRKQATQIWLLLHLCLARGAEALAELAEGNTGSSGEHASRTTGKEVMATLSWIAETLGTSITPLREALLRNRVPLPADDHEGPTALQAQLRPAIIDGLGSKVPIATAFEPDESSPLPGAPN